MIKLKRRIGSTFLACMMLLSLLPVTARAANDPIIVNSFNDLKNAQNAKEDSVVEISGNIEMTEAVTFANKITLKFTDSAKVTYTSDNNETLYLFTVQDGSTVSFEEGASITMTGDTENRTDSRDWRVIRSLGTLTFSECAGTVNVTNAKGRAFYGTTDLIFNCNMAADITIDNTVGANRNVFALYAQNNVVINGNLSGSIDVDFGGGNTAAGIYAGGITIIGDVTGDIDVRLGTSHNAFGLYAYSTGVKITGDISGSIYARGGSGSGYGIVAAHGDISIAKISGSVTGDCYNQVMKNSQSGASALYAAKGSIYGSSETTPIQLSGTLSSTVGRNDAFTVQAKGDVSIEISESGLIKAQSSYGAAWTGLEESYEEMSNNWGGAAAGVVAGGTINITGAGKDNISVVSADEKDTPVDAGFLEATGALSNVNNISTFLYYSARGDKEKALEAANKLTEEDKELINGYDEIIQDLNTVDVTSAQELQEALTKAKDGDIIALKNNITLETPLTGISGKTLIINGNGYAISFDPTETQNGVFGNDTESLKTGTNLTVNNLTIKNTSATAGRWASIVGDYGGGANGVTVNYNNCTFENLGSAVYVNPITNNAKPGVTLNILDCKYVNTDSAYSVDETSSGAYRDMVTANLEGSTGFDSERGTVENCVYLGDKSYGTDLASAIAAASKDDVITLMAGEYEITSIALSNKTGLTIQGAGMDKTVLKDTDGAYLVNLNTDDCSNITIKDLTLQGADNSSALLKVGDRANCSNLTIENVAFKDGTYGIYLGNDNESNFAANLQVKNCAFSGMSYAGIYAQRGDITVTGSTFEDIYSTDNTAAGILFDTDYFAGNSYDLTITDSSFKNITGTDASNKATGGVSITGTGTVDSFILTNNRFEGNTYDLHIGKVNGTPTFNATTIYGNGDINIYIPGENAKIYEATFMNGDTFVDLRVSDSNGKVVMPAAPSRAGYSFRGWYDGHNLYAAGQSVQITKDTTFVAQWSDNTPYYTITVKDAENGTVTCYAKSAAKGADVTLTVKADVGYQLDKLTVTDASGNVIDVEKVNNTTYTFVMPGSKVTVEAVFAPTTVEPSDLPFTDVSTSDWFYGAVKFVYENGLMDGVGNNLFAPNATLNRAMAVTILYRLEGSPAVTTDAGFNDVAAGTWYTDAVNWAAANNIVNGVEGNNFDPTGTLTREQMATVLYRYAQYKGADVSASGDLSGFVDSANVSSWAADAVKWAVGSGLVNGVEGNALAPQGTSTRAQAATVLMRFVG